MTQKSSVNFKALALWLLIGGLVGWQLNSSFTDETRISQNRDSENPTQEELDLDLFWDVWESIQVSYYDESAIVPTEETYGAISGLVESLDDPYSVFMSPVESEAFNQSLSSELEGVGMELTVREGKLIVVAPLKNSPAEVAGIIPGDFVYLVDDKPTSEMTLFDAIMSIRGEEGSQVKLTILREGSPDPIDFMVTRAKIEIPTVELSFQTVGEKNIAILGIYEFGDPTTAEFLKAVREIELQNPDGLILDLRLNGGGYLDSAVDVLGQFFEEKQKAVIVKHRDNENDVLYTQGNGALPEIPLVVLIDEGSASSSEILAGALQDYKRAVLMGEQSFGKGSVQELISLPDGSSLRLTVAKWFTPLERGFDEEGITPDIIVPMEYTEIDSENDLQVQSALDYLSDL